MMISLNDYLYSGDTVLKILKKYARDLEISATPLTSLRVSKRGYISLEAIMHSPGLLSLVTSTSQSMTGLPYFMTSFTLR